MLFAVLVYLILQVLRIQSTMLHRVLIKFVCTIPWWWMAILYDYK